MMFTVKELRTMRRLVVEEINNVAEWSKLPNPEDRRTAPARLAELEHILARIDGEIQAKTFLRKAQNEV